MPATFQLLPVLTGSVFAEVDIVDIATTMTLRITIWAIMGHISLPSFHARAQAPAPAQILNVPFLALAQAIDLIAQLPDYAS
jgi:hypothetical protein